MKRLRFVCLGIFFPAMTVIAQENKAPIRLAIVGLEHDHALGFIPRLQGRK